jgi:hypothetical protein
MTQTPSQKPTPPDKLWDAIPQIIGKVGNEFLLITLGVLILVIAIGAFAPGVVETLGQAFFYLLVVLAWLAFIIVRALDTWVKLRATSETPPKTEPAPPQSSQPEAPVAQPAPSIPPAAPVLRQVQDKADLRQRYLHRLLLECNQLHLTAIDRKVATSPEAAELDLSEVFTALDVSESGERMERGIEREIEIEKRMGRGEGRRAAIGELAENPRLVLLGEPGSGKTTLVRFVAVCLAGDELGLAGLNARRLGDEWAGLPRLFPVRVTLRDYAARGLPQGVGLWDFIVAELGRIEEGSLASFATELQRTLERQGGLLLLDGLDEVPDANQQRQRLKAAVERFAQDFPHCRVLVTSRPYAYQDPAWRLAGFELRRLTDFSREQIQNFIEKWYRQVAAKDASFGDDEAERYTAQLQSAVQTNPRLAELAPRPLLLTLMASLHRWRHGGALPDEREELYDESVKLLIDLWQRPKQKFDAQGNPAGEEYSVWDELCISPRNLRAALNQVAFKAHRDQLALTGTHDIPLDDLAGALFRASEDRAAISIERVCNYVRDRAGLLVDRGQDVFAFPHRTFQEYLAACHLTDHDFPRELARLARQDDERWREAVLLAAAKAARGSTSNVWLLAEALCPRALDETPTPQPNDYYAALRAAQALVETKQHQRVDDWNQGKLERLRGWLTASLTQTGLIPAPDRAAAGRALSAIGDRRPGVTVLLPSGRDRGGGRAAFARHRLVSRPGGSLYHGQP